MKHFSKTFVVLCILLTLLSSPFSLLVIQQAYAPFPFHHNHQECYESPRQDHLGRPVWFNLSIDVWGYCQQQTYYRTNHSITFDQGDGNMTINDFQLWTHNLTYYALNLNGEIVYDYSIPQSPPKHRYENSTFYEEDDVYSAFTYINCSVEDKWHDPEDDHWYNFTLTAGVSRRNDVAVERVGAFPRRVNPGENVTIPVDVKNEGAVNETFNVTVYRNDTVIETQTVSDLPPGNDTALTFYWNTSGVTSGDYEIKAEASNVTGEWDLEDNIYINGTITVNQTPNTPSKPSGPESGYLESEYNFTTSTTDSEGDDLTYMFDWGDGTNATVGPFQSGENASATHIWWVPDTYNVTVKTSDSHSWSNWSQPLTVNMTARIWYMQNAK
jgi:hypothetical protein